MSQHKAPEVQRAARQWLESGPDRAQGGFFVDYGLDLAISRLVGYEAPGDGGGYQSRWEWDRLHGQVQRAIDKLAAEGLLVKVKPSENGPDGRRHRFTMYYLPAEYERLSAERDERRSLLSIETARKDAVTAEIERILGHEVGTTGHLPDLTVEQWWELLGRLS